jgi:two-component system, NarL family, nitrate/nitrite response regulator NarL
MQNTKKIRLAFVDDHQIIIDGLIALIKDNPNIEIVCSANSGEAMLKLLNNNTIDVLLTDVVMDGMNGQQLAKEVKKLFPAIKIIALSMSGVGEIVEDMINNADINGYLLKQTHKDELIQAVEKVYQGGAYFQPKILEALALQSRIKQDTEDANLTKREIEIIKLLAKDQSNKQIAETLFISVRTVETHRKNILFKTNTNNLLSLLNWAYTHKVLER